MSEQKLFAQGGGISERARMMAAVPREDDGYFGPDSVFWRMLDRDALAPAWGLANFMFPVFLYPSSGKTWLDDRTYHTDVLSLMQRMVNIILLLTFGDKRTARFGFEKYQEAHETFNGRYTHDDQRFHGMDIEGQLWVFCSLWYSLYTSNQRFGRYKLTEAETEQFFREGVVFADECGIPATFVPVTREQYRVFFRDAFDKLVIIPEGSINLQNMMIRPNAGWAGIPVPQVFNPLIWLAWKPILAAIVSIYPARMQEMLGIRHLGRWGGLAGLGLKALSYLTSPLRPVRIFLPRLAAIGPEGVGVAVSALLPELVRDLPVVAQTPPDQEPIVAGYFDHYTPRVHPEPVSWRLGPWITYIQNFFRAQRAQSVPASLCPYAPTAEAKTPRA